jgi:hypothetical protein
MGFTGAFAMFWFQGLLVGKTGHPPTMVRGPDAAAGLLEVVWDAGFALGLAVGRAVAVGCADADADAVGGPGR